MSGLETRLENKINELEKNQPGLYIYIIKNLNLNYIYFFIIKIKLMS